MPTPDAVVLLNLGSPAAPTVPAVRVFLREFLDDPRVIALPFPLRKLLLEGVILPFRAKKSAARYAKIWTREGSPLVAETERLRARVARELGGNARVLCAMRCGEPGLEAAARELRAAGARDVLAIPLFPQRAESSWDSAAERAKEVFRKRAPQIRLRFAAPFFAEPGYVGALAETTENALRGRAFDKLLISFHGVPAAAKRAESYRAECLTTAEKLAAALRLPRERWEAAFQSRFGRGKWIGPATDARLRALPAEGARRLAVVSPSFVADCLESLEEIGVAGRELFLAAGGESFCAVPCLNASPAFARFLSEIVRSRAAA